MERAWRGFAIIYASKNNIAERLCEEMKKREIPCSLFSYKEANFENIWKCYDGIIFTMALSGAVRTVCKYAQSKDKDPAVIAIDDEGKFVIPILGAHWGANEYAEEIARLLGSTPVITTASELSNITSVEEFARLINCKILNVENVVKVTSALLRGEEVCVKGLKALPKVKGKYKIGDDCNYFVIIGENQGNNDNAVYLKPLKLSIGIGSKIETDERTIEEAILFALNKINADISQVEVISSVREKVRKVAEKLGVKFRLLSLDEVNSFEDECLSPQSEKLKELGIRNVAEACALISAGKNAKLILRKIPYKGEVTVSIASIGD
ncbi:cobalt-precorrin 5A hydrolase [Acidianus ambivalens]|uniref:Cobalt-precorrin 5A hydrolase n=1 Tax=Acidianus ambivalens TaxID=2283 RepID=A0A650CVE3_ACIAM|nr:cobalt-precorrin 5A hydrolase [Acidianus ambivalens]MQL56017.1 cobalt-precorrin 5A hydrolase [Acidianus ambivalens]QGR21427.1 cobalt-precorrin 5A hydrolase [Acidianus ambivalens]